MKPIRAKAASLSGFEPRFASLTAGLLARKGQAKPAMRPGGSLGGYAGHDDLGWNDMGQGSAPAPEMPEPVRQQAEIAATFEAPAEPAPAPIAIVAEPAAEAEPAAILPVPAPMPARLPAGAKAKAAFTLRLAPERHLRLRLACAVTHKSAQALVTEALDTLLDSMPALAALADACPAGVPGQDDLT